MTPQEIFEKVSRHLLTQNKRSMLVVPGDSTDHGCAYRGQDGLRCAVGCLITDEVYEEAKTSIPKSEYAFPGLEEFSVVDDCVIDALVKSGVVNAYSSLPFTFLNVLQHTHDVIPPAGWRKELLDVVPRRFPELHLDASFIEKEFPCSPAPLASTPSAL